MQKSKNASHARKVKIAKKMNRVPYITPEGKLDFKLLRSGHFLTQLWDERRKAIAAGVANKIEKIKLVIQKKKDAAKQV